MAWLEMSRDPLARPAGWRLGECLWSPRRKADGASWGFWETMRSVEPGDAVFHLCGHSGKAAFTSVSTALSGCIEIDEGPEGPAELYRVELTDHIVFPQPVQLITALNIQENALLNYYKNNAQKASTKERLFYVYQNKKLQCLNGAYLSQLSSELLELLLGIQSATDAKTSLFSAVSTTTGVALKEAASRVGHQAFARNVKQNYGYRCAFPGCNADEPGFLVGGHIARWADAEALRGETSNGLCLCVLHDKAFEMGAFSLTIQGNVTINPKLLVGSWLHQLISLSHGLSIIKAAIPPSYEALKHHWRLHGFSNET